MRFLLKSRQQEVRKISAGGRWILSDTRKFMLVPGPAKRVIIHLNEDTSSEHDFLHKAVLEFLYSRGVAGATVIRPQAGFGSHHQLHTAGAGSVEGEHLPIRIEFLESPEVVDSLLPALCELVTDGLVETQPATVVKWAQQVRPV